MSGTATKPRVGVVDYGTGNLRSIRVSLEAFGYDLGRIQAPKDLALCDVILLPGVGNFAFASSKLHSAGLKDELRAWVAGGRPLLGICLGMQLLFESSEEGSQTEGLGVIQGRVERLSPTSLSSRARIPNVGWRELSGPGAPSSSSNHFHVPLANGDVSVPPWMFFAHSYAVMDRGEFHASFSAWHGEARYVAIVSDARVMGVQGHPELSGKAGARFLAEALANL